MLKNNVLEECDVVSKDLVALNLTKYCNEMNRDMRKNLYNGLPI